MTDPELVRRLTTIMDIDVVGFSTMSSRDEEHALGLLNARMATAQTLVRQHRGRVFKLTGDGLLAEFASPVEAVRAALEIQEAMRAANDPAGPDDQLILRIGVNLGDVVESGDDLMGDAVNVAARLESIAKPGGVCVSAAVYEQIAGKLTLGAEDMGDQHVKNIPRPIHAYRLTPGGGVATVAMPTAPAPVPRSTSRLAVVLGSAAVVAILALGGAWLLHERSEPAPLAAKIAQAPAPAPTPAPATPPVAGAPAPATATAPPQAPTPPPTPAPSPAANPPSPPAQAAQGPAPANLPAPPPAAVPVRAYSPADVPFVPDRMRWRLDEYASAEGYKAMAVNVRGWFGVAVRRVDADAARHGALEACNDTVQRQIPIVREFDRCMIYAVDNDVVWTYRAPPMPPAPYFPAEKLSPPVPFDPQTVPLIREPGRRNLADHYLKSTMHRALVLGHGHLDWWAPGESDADAIRRNLQTCGHITGRPCIVYSINDQVVVRVPQLHPARDVFTPQVIPEPAQQAALERYLIADDWRAIAAANDGRLGIVSGRASETAAVADAIAECSKAGGNDCTLLAVGPFLVDRR